MTLGKEVGLGPHCAKWGPMQLPSRQNGAELPPPQFSAHVYCGQTARWIKMPLGTETELGPGDFLLDGAPQFSDHVYCSQTAGGTKITLGMELGLGPGNVVLDGNPAPLPQKGGTPAHLSAHVHCGQTVVCIRIPLGTDIVLDGYWGPMQLPLP